MLRAVESLEREHRTIEKVIRVVSVLVEELTDSRKVDDDLLRDLCRFLRVYSNQCHHGKEESYLFPELEAYGVPVEGCPLGALRHEHERSRMLTQALAQAASAYSADPYSGRQAFLEVLRELATFYPAHIWKEEYLLFPLAAKVLSADDDNQLLQNFASVESDIFSDAHQTYEQLAANLAERVLTASPKMRAVSGKYSFAVASTVSLCDASSTGPPYTNSSFAASPDADTAARERGLDETLKETFPCSDALSAIPDPPVLEGPV